MPLSNFALDTFVSQELSKLTSCAPESLAAEFPDRSHWLDHFILKRIFHDHIPADRAPLAFALIRRAESALDEWELACDAARQGIRRPSVYFKVLRHLDACLAALWQFLDFAREAAKTKVFEKGDGSVGERLNWLYTKGRHFDPQALPSGDLHRLWLTNDGLHTREHAVTFDEVREELRRLGRMAQTIAKGPSDDAGC